MFEQDRPIKPDPKAIQQYQNKLKEKQKQHQQYLRKGVSTILPCQKQNYINKINKKRANFEAKISKAEQYEQIKSKNRQKFGQWKRNNDTQNNLNIENTNKIKPHQITVGYKPKKVHIDTREYKKPGYKPENESSKQKENKQSEEQKLEYQKMIQYLKRMFGEFEKQKSQFEKQKQYLMFKKVIQNQEGIQIAPKVSTGLNKRNKIQSSKSLEEINKEVQIISNISNEEMCPEPENSNKIHKFNYTIDKLYECNPFTLEQISKYTNHQEFIIENSRLYQQARQILDTQRNNPKNKIKIIKPKCTHGSIGANHSVCTEQQCTQKRITKFVGEREGWFQLWIAGRYRTVYNKNIGYKVVWYNNNDIKQEFSNGRVIVYEHKAKKVIQVQVDKKMPFWYFPLLNQLQMKDQKGNKQIIFSDGGHQVIVCSQIF